MKTTATTATATTTATTAETAVRTIVRQVDDQDGRGIVKTYELRGLHDEADIPIWADFCASVFRYKTNPPPALYFERHYWNDPHRKASFVRVAVDLDTQEIVSSCRIFVRHISSGPQPQLQLQSKPTPKQPSNPAAQATDKLLHNIASSFLHHKTMLAGGIGEVCTLEDHRRRGLFKELLQDCIQIMKEAGMTVSLLHSAPEFFPVYQSVGYSCTTSQWSVVPLSRDNLQEIVPSLSPSTLATAPEKQQQQQQQQQLADESPLVESSGATDPILEVRKASFPLDSNSLFLLHQQYSEHRLGGCIIRSKDYWDHYVSKELEHNLWIATLKTNTVGWMAIRQRGTEQHRYQLQEFGLDLQHHNTDWAVIFATLFLKATQDLPFDDVVLSMPTLVVNDLKAASSEMDDDKEVIDWEEVVSEDDHGWMYKPLVERGAVIPTEPHLIWPTDSF